MGTDENNPHAGADGHAAAPISRAPGEGAADAVVVFNLSDSTGVTAETLGASLVAQFPTVRFVTRTYPFIATANQANTIVSGIDELIVAGRRALVVCTVIDPGIRAILTATLAPVVDLFTENIQILERALGVPAVYALGRAHGQGDLGIYQQRMKAIEYAIEHDDAQSLRNLDAANVILIGPSRCGKTPTSMYLALQHGLFVANYPLLEEDYQTPGLPTPLKALAKRCVGITTTPLRLSQVRSERRPGSTYASLSQCTFEVRHAESLYRTHRIPLISSAVASVEEMSAVILHTLHLPGIGDALLGSSAEPNPKRR